MHVKGVRGKESRWFVVHAMRALVAVTTIVYHRMTAGVIVVRPARHRLRLMKPAVAVGSHLDRRTLMNKEAPPAARHADKRCAGSE